VPSSDAADIDRAVAAARAAFENPAWSGMRPADRERMLLRLADLVEAHADELAELEVLNNGMTMFTARYIDVGSTIDLLRYMAGWATKIEGSTVRRFSIPHAPDQKFFTKPYANRLASSAPSCPGTYRCWSPHRKSRRPWPPAARSC